MNELSHQQARRYLDAAADDLIKSEERSLLDDHLKSCEACRAYADDLNALAPALRRVFRAHAEGQRKPSGDLIRSIQRRNRSAVMTNRITASLRLAAGAAFLILLALAFQYMISKQQEISSPATPLVTGLTPVATGTAPLPGIPDNRLIVFASSRDGNSEIYAMRTDGSRLTNLTNNPAYDGNPAWSPDGSKIAFESDRNGNRDIYVMNSDGSGVTRITNDPANDILIIPNIGSVTSPNIWSPDGTHLLFFNNRSGKAILYVVSADGSNVTQLAQTGAVAEAVWSPDGKQVAYLPDDQNAQVIAINADGTNRREIAIAGAAEDNTHTQTIIAWSQDEQFLYYHYETLHGTWYILKVDTNGAHTSQELASGFVLEEGGLIGSWLGNDSAVHFATQTTSFQFQATWYAVGVGKIAHWDLAAVCGISLTTYSGKRPLLGWSFSHAGTQAVLGILCPDKGYSEVYSLDLKTATFTRLARYPLAWAEFDEIHINWSADDRVVSIQANHPADNKAELYVLNAQELQKQPPAAPTLIWDGENINAILQPVATRPAPVLETPDNRLVVFASSREGNSEINVMKTDGSGLTNLTNNPAYDGNPAWSPDGSKIAFESDRSGNRDIYVMNSDGSGVTRVTSNPGNDTLLTPSIWSDGKPDIWSPDGSRLLFSNDRSGKPILYVVGADGSNVTQLTQTDSAIAAVWSPDGKQVAYLAGDQSGNIIAINADGTDRREIAMAGPVPADIGSPQIIGWAHDEQFLYYQYEAHDGNWYILKVDTNGAHTWQELATGYAIVQGSLAGSWLGKDSAVYFATQTMANQMAWHTVGVGKTARWEPNVVCGVNVKYNGDPVRVGWASSHTGTQVVLGISCPNKGYSELYYLDLKTATFTRIIEYPLAWGMDIQISWSADDRLVAVQANNPSTNSTELYILNAEELQKQSPAASALIWNGKNINALLQPFPLKDTTSSAP